MTGKPKSEMTKIGRKTYFKAHVPQGGGRGSSGGYGRADTRHCTGPEHRPRRVYRASDRCAGRVRRAEPLYAFGSQTTARRRPEGRRQDLQHRVHRPGRPVRSRAGGPDCQQPDQQRQHRLHVGRRLRRRPSTRFRMPARRRASPACRRGCRGSHGISAAAPSRASLRRSSGTYHFGFGMANFSHAYISHWSGPVETNRKVAFLNPNDAGRQRAAQPLGAAPRGGRLRCNRSRPLRERHAGLLRPDRRVQGGELRDLHHRPDTAGFRRVLAPGGTAGIHAAGQDRPGIEDLPVSVAGRGARLAGAEDCDRCLLASDLSLPVAVLQQNVTRARRTISRCRPAGSGTRCWATTLRSSMPASRR